MLERWRNQEQAADNTDSDNAWQKMTDEVRQGHAEQAEQTLTEKRRHNLMRCYLNGSDWTQAAASDEPLSPEQEDEFWVKLREDKSSPHDALDSIIEKIPRPIDLLENGAEVVAQRIYSDPMQSGLFELTFGGNSIGAHDVEGALETAPSILHFDDRRFDVSSALRQIMPPENHEQCKKAFDRLATTLYGEQAEYYEQAQELINEAED